MHEEGQAALNVIVGTILIFWKNARGLFDTGVYCLFISIGYVNAYDNAMELLDEHMYVTTPINRSFVTKGVCKSCSLRIGANDFIVNLIVLEIAYFDVILRMDWFFDNYVIVNCQEK